MSPHKGYMNIAIAAMLFAAAFAGVVFIADEDVAAAEESQSQAQEYTVTYSYDGFVFSEKTSDGQLTVRGFNTASEGETSEPKYSAALSDAEAPEGYAFDHWVSGSAIYEPGDSARFGADATLTPVFKLNSDHAEITLIYGDISETYLISGSESIFAIAPENLVNFAEKIGADVVKTGESITGFAIDGYKFNGFKDAKGTGIGISALTSSAGVNTSYTLVMEKVYTVSFVLDGTVLKSEKTSGDIVAPENPVKEHYVFDGWFDKDGKKFDPAFKAYTADITYTAEFIPNTYKVYFMNGETVVAERSSEYMGQIDLPDLPDGFVSWADKDGNVVGSPVTITGPDMKFYAVAGIVKYSVAFVNGEQTVATVEVVKGEKIAADDIPALPEGVEKWDFDFETPITENITVKAVAKVYDVTFDFGVMYAAMNVTIQVEHGQVIPADKVPVIPEEFPEKDKRWNYDPAAPVESDMTIQLRDNIYFEVVFVAGETEVAKVSVLEGTAVPADKVPAIPEGYKEWAFDVAAPVTADMTVEAVAKEVVFNVTFEIEGKADVTQKSDSMTLPVTDREGYVFQGWVVKGQTQYVDPMTYAITEDITFVAVYKEADAPAGPDFIDTNEGKCVLILIGVALVAFAYAVYTNMFGLKDKLTSVKLVRVKKE